MTVNAITGSTGRHCPVCGVLVGVDDGRGSLRLNAGQWARLDGQFGCAEHRPHDVHVPSSDSNPTRISGAWARGAGQPGDTTDES